MLITDNSRYYYQVIKRFINADSQLSGVGGDIGGYNLFAYCGNNPVNRVDSTGQAWYHWVLGGVIIVGCAAATVITAGGFAAGIAAVAAAGSSMAATTVTSTIAAGAFIGATAVYGLAVADAVLSSNSPQEFAANGNWGTVAATAGGAVAGGVGASYGYTNNTSKNSYLTSPQQSSLSNSSGRTEPFNLLEKLAMEQVKSSPYAGTHLKKIVLNDSRWSASDGWIKMQQVIDTSQGKITIHYVYNQILDIFDDFKYK